MEISCQVPFSSRSRKTDHAIWTDSAPREVSPQRSHPYIVRASSLTVRRTREGSVVRGRCVRMHSTLLFTRMQSVCCWSALEAGGQGSSATTIPMSHSLSWAPSKQISNNLLRNIPIVDAHSGFIVAVGKPTGRGVRRCGGRWVLLHDSRRDPFSTREQRKKTWA
jgi:hypothetical protein